MRPLAYASPSPPSGGYGFFFVGSDASLNVQANTQATYH